MTRMSNERAIKLLDAEVQPVHENEMFEAWKHLYDNDLLFELEGFYIEAFTYIVRENEQDIGITIH